MIIMKFNFNLNEMQKEVIKLKKDGRNDKIILDADTGSGKTEAILLAINEGSTVDWLLPTISSCIFMYRRLCHDFPDLNIEVLTSIMKERRYVENPLFSIRIYTPDPAMISYITGVLEGRYYPATSPVLVLDELDNYPEMVRAVLDNYINTIKLDQIIVASATMDEAMKETFNSLGFNTITYRRDNCIKFKYDIIDGQHDIRGLKRMLDEHLYKRRIVCICNAICNMETLAEDLSVANSDINWEISESSRFIYLHSNLSLAERDIVEKKIFENDYDILISNDLIAFSIDFDAKVGLVEITDKMNVNVQRLGRFNRRNLPVSYKNLYIVDGSYKPGFIDSYDARENEEFFLNKSSYTLTNSDWSKMRESIKLGTISYDDTVDFVSNQIKLELPVKLRDVPVSFLVPITTTVSKGKKKNKKKITVNTHKIIKWGSEFPWAALPCSIENGPKDLVDLGYEGLYKITDLKKVYDGNIPVEPYSGDQYIVPIMKLNEEEMAAFDELVDFVHYDENYKWSHPYGLHFRDTSLLSMEEEEIIKLLSEKMPSLMINDYLSTYTDSLYTDGGKVPVFYISVSHVMPNNLYKAWENFIFRKYVDYKIRTILQMNNAVVLDIIGMKKYEDFEITIDTYKPSVIKKNALHELPIALEKTGISAKYEGGYITGYIKDLDEKYNYFYLKGILDDLLISSDVESIVDLLILMRNGNGSNFSFTLHKSRNEKVCTIKSSTNDAKRFKDVLSWYNNGIDIELIGDVVVVTVPKAQYRAPLAMALELFSDSNDHPHDDATYDYYIGEKENHFGWDTTKTVKLPFEEGTKAKGYNVASKVGYEAEGYLNLDLGYIMNALYPDKINTIPVSFSIKDSSQPDYDIKSLVVSVPLAIMIYYKNLSTGLVSSARFVREIPIKDFKSKFSNDNINSKIFDYISELVRGILEKDGITNSDALADSYINWVSRRPHEDSLDPVEYMRDLYNSICKKPWDIKLTEVNTHLPYLKSTHDGLGNISEEITCMHSGIGLEFYGPMDKKIHEFYPKLDYFMMKSEVRDWYLNNIIYTFIVRICGGGKMDVDTRWYMDEKYAVAIEKVKKEIYNIYNIDKFKHIEYNINNYKESLAKEAGTFKYFVQKIFKDCIDRVYPYKELEIYGETLNFGERKDFIKNGLIYTNKTCCEKYYDTNDSSSDKYVNEVKKYFTEVVYLAYEKSLVKAGVIKPLSEKAIDEMKHLELIDFDEIEDRGIYRGGRVLNAYKIRTPEGVEGLRNIDVDTYLSYSFSDRMKYILANIFYSLSHLYRSGKRNDNEYYLMMNLLKYNDNIKSIFLKIYNHLNKEEIMNMSFLKENLLDSNSRTLEDLDYSWMNKYFWSEADELVEIYSRDLGISEETLSEDIRRFTRERLDILYKEIQIIKENN